MLPDRHEMIYQSLESLTDRVCSALKDADPDVLILLTEEQNTLLEELRKAGVPTDNRLFGQMQSLNHRVSCVISEIQQCQQVISTRMTELADGKKLARAYGT